MPRRLIGDAHEWVNEFFTVLVLKPVKQFSRERSRADKRGKKTLLSLTLVCVCSDLLTR